MKLADYLNSKSLNDAEFAALCDCDRSTIYRIRKEQTKPTAALMEEIAKQTGGLVQPNDYFDGLPEAEAA
jgi:transcriptional regulator with XRE-family HTH domain